MTARSHPTRLATPTGIGLIQVMLVLLLVGTVLAAGVVFLQSKRAPAQATTQEQTLRWADEALAAFASAHARLPCPATTRYGEEDCADGHAQGWLPLRTLAGASGNGVTLGPVSYMVYRGDRATHLDLTAPGNAYQPPLTDGSIREIITKDEDGEEISRRPFAAINGLDLCQSLNLAENANLVGTDTALARVAWQNGNLRNVAYGIAAAGPIAGDTSRLDGINATGSAMLEEPWRQWDTEYDDRVRIRTFGSVAQMLGCRQQATANRDDISLAGMDVLAAAVTLHDSLELLSANNLIAAEAAVESATNAQISIIFKLVTTAASLSDHITTLITSAGSLTRAIATCIASLGATCWEVPLKVSAVVTSIVSLGEKGVTLAQKAAALTPAALALDASIKARDMARDAAEPPPQNLDEVRKQMECTLYARSCPSEGEPKIEKNPDYDPRTDSPDEEYRVVYKRDANGNPIPRLGEDGLPMYDSDGNPLYEVEYDPDSRPKGLDERVQEAESEWKQLQKHVDKLEEHRLAPWGVSVLNTVDEDGKVTYEIRENGQIKDRINVPQTTFHYDFCDGDLSTCRYGKEVRKEVCKNVGQGNGEYTLSGNVCKPVPSTTETDDDGNEVIIKHGDRDLVVEVSYVFDMDKAVEDVTARREKAEEWASLNLRSGELDKEISNAEENFDSWFEGNNSILSKMENQRDDAHHCGASPKTEMTEQKCTNATNAVRYIEHCEKPETRTECREVGEDNGYYVDAACSVPSDSTAIYAWVEISSKDTYVKDTNPLATCKPNMQARIKGLKDEKSRLRGNLNDIKSAYDALKSPYVEYPKDWFSSALEAQEDGDGNVIGHEWVTSNRSEEYWEQAWDDSDPPELVRVRRTRRLPYYAPEPWDSSGSSPLLVTSDLTLRSKNNCPYLFRRRWIGWLGWGLPASMVWDLTFKYGMYCQRYPLNRAFEDWRRAKEGADQARQHYLDTKEQFESLEEKYKRLSDPSGSAGGDQLAIGFGAEPALERADARGSTGPQRLGTGP